MTSYLREVQDKYNIRIKLIDEHLEVYNDSQFLFSVDNINELKKELKQRYN